MKKGIFIIVLFIFCLTLFGCSDEDKTGEGKAYELIYKDYVGVAEVTVKNGKVETIDFDEYFLPHVWAKITVEGTEEEGEMVYPNNVIHINGTTYAKYININGKVFTGEYREGGVTIDDVAYSNQIIKYSSGEITDLYVHLKNSEEACMWYVNAIQSDKAFVSSSDGVALTTYASANTLGWSKIEGKYWSGESYPLGWQGNIDALVASLKGKALKDVTLVQGTADTLTGLKYWSIDNVKTGATLTGIQQYYDLMYKAYKKAID